MSEVPPAKKEQRGLGLRVREREGIFVDCQKTGTGRGGGSLGASEAVEIIEDGVD